MTSASKNKASFALLIAMATLSACSSKAQEGGSESAAEPSQANVAPVAVPVVRNHPILSATSPLYISYPHNGDSIGSSSSFVVGAALPGGELFCNGKPVLLNRDGFFANVVPLSFGSNSFELVYKPAGGNAYTKTISVKRERGRAPLPPTGMTISPDNIQPKEDRGLTTGDIIEFSCHATPGGQMTVDFGGKVVKLTSMAGLRAQRKAQTLNINQGLAAAYGQVFQRYPANSPDLYLGLYRVEAADVFYNAHPRFVLNKDGKTTNITLGTSLSVVKQPRMAHTLKDDTIVRVAPDLARLTPIPAGVRLLTDGYQGENIRILYKPGKHVWIKREELEFEPEGAPAPHAVPRTIQVSKDDYGETVSVPLTQRLPFIVEQNLKPNKLVLKIFGAHSDTDWVYQAPDGEAAGKIIDDIAWKQPEDYIYEVDISLKGARQWGYYADYKDNTLNLHIKRKPQLSENTERSLEGLVICLDPGHGGKESGALGPSGITEAEVNYAITEKLRKILEGEGAKVYMTRTKDIDVSLNDRTDFARKTRADVLVSVHNNALPDGRDPLKEHGTSTYRYHPQSVELARVIKDHMVQGLGLPDIGARYQNLALCRPTAMPAVLVEVAFMVNPDEYSNLINEAWQNKAAKSLANGIVSYFKETPSK